MERRIRWFMVSNASYRLRRMRANEREAWLGGRKGAEGWESRTGSS